MTRLTKSEIESRLLEGGALRWKDAAKKSQEIQLADGKSRRLFDYLLSSDVRKPTELPPKFVEGIIAAFGATGDPATKKADVATKFDKSIWRLHSIETEGFGGLNVWAGPVFAFQFDGESLMLEGPNGSGKSSLTSAIIWALTGDRPRDDAEAPAHVPQPVFTGDNKPAGDWPPIACYPEKASDLKTSPFVRVTLLLKDEIGTEAKVERRLSKGEIETEIDAALQLPDVLIESGILMPARLARLRLSGGGGRLTEAVQKLTGLDDLIAIGLLVEGLCHKGREFQSYRTKELATSKAEFLGALELAEQALATVNIEVPTFATKDTTDREGEMAKFGAMLRSEAAELAKVVADDISGDIDLSKPAGQNTVIAAIGAAQSDLKAGLDGVSFWKLISGISSSLAMSAREGLKTAVAEARSRSGEAIDLLERSQADSRFQLKVVAAHWHERHGHGDIHNCPVCSHELAANLSDELNRLRTLGDAAARTFDDNLAAILSKLNGAVPAGLRILRDEDLSAEPKDALEAAIRAMFISNQRYSASLVGLVGIAEAALSSLPEVESVAPSVPSSDERLASVSGRISQIERMIALADWFIAAKPLWEKWWSDISGSADVSEAATPKAKRENLNEHLIRLSEALTKAEPYRKGAEAIGKAWQAGVKAYGIEQELALRDEIGTSLVPLKLLGSLCESVAREAIEGLSSRVESLLKDVLLAENFKFQGTELNRKSGIVVRGGFNPELRIDATLVANTSWLRALLWCFVFALREEAVEQLGADRFPVAVFDDPQATFDAFHRARWARYVASLQHGPSKVQVVLTTHEELFVDLLVNDGITGRQALIASADAESGHATILEGAALERLWEAALIAKTAQSAVVYIDRTRVFVEGMMKLMLRGEESKTYSMVLGKLRELLRQLGDAGKAPWNAPAFKSLVVKLNKDRPEIKYLEGSHHTTGHSFGMQEGQLVEDYFRKELHPTLQRAYRTAREHRLLHGGMKALHAAPPTAALPEGYKTRVKSIPLIVLGRAAALTDGRAADGSIDMLQLDKAEHRPVVLGSHSAFHLSARTLEPVARPGDILITKEAGEPSNRSLVVVISDDRVLARRYEISENQTDIAVLVAQAINPRQIAAPIVALKSTLKLHKVVGVMFGGKSASPRPSEPGHEVCDCGGEAAISAVASGALGLVEVVGESAEPLALDSQYLIVKDAVSPSVACASLNGQPIIAEDDNGNCFFKRLHVLSTDRVILESLEISGDFPPLSLAIGEDTSEPSLKRVWPVAGVLFELP